MPAPTGTTRDAILDAVDRLLVTTGFRKITMEDIAVAAGVSRRTIYVYFASKEEVGLSSIDRVVAATYAHLERIAAGGRDPAEVLHALLVERVLFRVDSVHSYRASLDELFEAVRPAYMARRRQQHDREVGLIADVVADGCARRRFACDDEPAAVAATLVAATNAFLPYSLSVQELGERARIEAGVRRMAGLLLKSLTADAPAVTGARRRPTTPVGARRTRV